MLSEKITELFLYRTFYRIGGDPLTQLILFNYIFFSFFFSFFIRNAESDTINGNYDVGDPLTHLRNQANIPA